MTADYSQIEMRIMAHLSGDEALIEAFNSAFDFHAATASSVFHVPVEEVVPDQRRKIKAMNYGLAYGLSAFGLSNQLTHLHRRGARADGGVLRALRRRPRLPAGGGRAARVQDGYTATILGRRRYLPDLTSDNRQRREMAERMALNAPIQGSAADIIKVAMLRVDEALRDSGLRSRMLLQVHDELVFDVAPGERERAGGAGPAGDGRGLPAVGPARGLGRRRAATGTAPTTDRRPAAASVSRWPRRCGRVARLPRSRRPIAQRLAVTPRGDPG